MECPVCQNTEISPFATHCPKCGTDVVAYPLLDDLEEQVVETLKEKLALEGNISALEQLRKEEKTSYRKQLGRMYWFLFLLPLMFFWCGKKNVAVEDTTAIMALENQKDSLAKVLEQQQATNKKLEQELQQLKAKPKKVSHVIRKGESFYRLAEKYLDNGTQWRKIRALNPQIVDEDLLIPGDTVIITLRK